MTPIERVNQMFDKHLRGGRRDHEAAVQVAALLRSIDGGEYRIENGRVLRPMNRTTQ